MYSAPATRPCRRAGLLLRLPHGGSLKECPAATESRACAAREGQDLSPRERYKAVGNTANTELIALVRRLASHRLSQNRLPAMDGNLVCAVIMDGLRNGNGHANWDADGRADFEPVPSA
jgi:hypothetical protein